MFGLGRLATQLQIAKGEVFLGCISRLKYSENCFHITFQHQKACGQTLLMAG